MSTKQNKKNRKIIDNKKNVDKQKNILKNRVYLGYYPRYIIKILCAIIPSILFFLFLCLGVDFKSNKFEYDFKPEISYNVYLKDNEYYKEKYLKEDMQYITGLIDYIDLNLNYKIKTNKKADYQYKYSIKADVVITDRNNSNKVLYTNNEILKDEKTVEKNQVDNLILKENLKINYDQYDGLVNSFKGKYSISVSSNLKITMHIDTILKNNLIKDKIVDSEDLTVLIPLSEQTINILKEYNVKGKKGSLSNKIDVKVINIYYLLGAIVLLLISIKAIQSLVDFIKSTSNNSLYVKRLNQLLKDYDKIIVSINKLPDISNSCIIEVESFEELLDAKKNLGKPILHIEIHKKQKSYFLIFSDNNVYRYTLKEVDLINK